MSINAEIFEHPNAGFYYVVLQHNEVYQVSSLKRGPDQRCDMIGQMWPNGEASLGVRLGPHLRLGDVPKEVRDRLSKLIINKIENV